VSHKLGAAIRRPHYVGVIALILLAFFADVYMAERIPFLAQLSAELMFLPTGVNTQAQASTVSSSRIMKARCVSFGEHLAVTKALRPLTSRSGESDVERKAKGSAAK